MKVLVIGNGAREHTLVWKLAQSLKVSEIYVAPGNAGTGVVAQNLNIPPADIEALSVAAALHKIDLTVVGPEVPLALGIVDLFEGLGLPIFGSARAATQLESSKVFAKRLMEKYGIPCAGGAVFHSLPGAMDYIESRRYPLVIKADGLAAGKGVIIANSEEQASKALSDIIKDKIFGNAGNQVIVDECLVGKEVSLHAFIDSEKRIIKIMPPACDYKRVFDGDLGLNTGGMGSYSSPSFFGVEEIKIVLSTILEPLVHALNTEGIIYKGVLYVGLMVTDGGIKVLEFNVRFGDPETQVIIPRLKTDLVDIMLAVINGNLDKINIQWDDEFWMGVVMAAIGYPGAPKDGFPIFGIEDIDPGVLVFHAGTKSLTPTGIMAKGGRILTLVTHGRDSDEARHKLYPSIEALCIRNSGFHYRTDIAAGE